MYVLEMAKPGPARGPKPGRAGPKILGPRALRAETGRNWPNKFPAIYRFCLELTHFRKDFYRIS